MKLARYALDRLYAQPAWAADPGGALQRLASEQIVDRFSADLQAIVASAVN